MRKKRKPLYTKHEDGIKVVNLPAKPSPQTVHQEIEKEASLLSFVPAGMPRSIAEYLVALLPGAILLFAFFVAAEVAVIFLGDGSSNLLALSFLPVICIMPILSGVVSTLVLEKLRNKPLTATRGALVGAAAGLAGAIASVILLSAVAFFAGKFAFGSSITGVLFYVSLLPILVIEAVLGALGGAAVVKVIKET